MADEPAEITADEDVLELTAEVDGEDAATTGAEDEDGEDEITVSFGDDDPATDKPDDNNTIKRMREELRKARADLAEARKTTAPAKIEVGEKPTLADCDFDEEEFEKQLDASKDRKAQADKQGQDAEQQQAVIRKSWEDSTARYQAKKAELAAPDFEDCELAIDEALGPQLSPVILKAAVDPAAMVVALGRNPAKLAELAKIKDPFELTAAIARLEGGVKVTRGKRAPAPDRPVTGSASMPGSTDKQLEKLEKEADRTGDRTKLVAYKKTLKAKADK